MGAFRTLLRKAVRACHSLEPFPTWEDDYATLVVLDIAGSAIDSDPYESEPAADMIASVKQWWEARHASILSQRSAH